MSNQEEQIYSFVPGYLPKIGETAKKYLKMKYDMEKFFQSEVEKIKQQAQQVVGDKDKLDEKQTKKQGHTGEVIAEYVIPSQMAFSIKEESNSILQVIDPVSKQYVGFDIDVTTRIYELYKECYYKKYLAGQPRPILIFSYCNENLNFIQETNIDNRYPLQGGMEMFFGKPSDLGIKVPAIKMLEKLFKSSIGALRKQDVKNYIIEVSANDVFSCMEEIVCFIMRQRTTESERISDITSYIAKIKKIFLQRDYIAYKKFIAEAETKWENCIKYYCKEREEEEEWQEEKQILVDWLNNLAELFTIEVTTENLKKIKIKYKYDFANHTDEVARELFTFKHLIEGFNDAVDMFIDIVKTLKKTIKNNTNAKLMINPFSGEVQNIRGKAYREYQVYFRVLVDGCRGSIMRGGYGTMIDNRLTWFAGYTFDISKIYEMKERKRIATETVKTEAVETEADQTEMVKTEAVETETVENEKKEKTDED